MALPHAVLRLGCASCCGGSTSPLARPPPSHGLPPCTASPLHGLLGLDASVVRAPGHDGGGFPLHREEGHGSEKPEDHHEQELPVEEKVVTVEKRHSCTDGLGRRKTGHNMQAVARAHSEPPHPHPPTCRPRLSSTDRALHALGRAPPVTRSQTCTRDSRPARVTIEWATVCSLKQQLAENGSSNVHHSQDCLHCA